MNEKIEHLYSKLNQKTPAFLMLGQDYLRFSTGKDPFLSEIIHKYNKGEEVLNYKQILKGEAKKEREEALHWMQRMCENIPQPEWLETVASFPWSGVYTSAIDVIWQKAFEAEWRELKYVYDPDISNSNGLRSRSQLHCTFLYGCVDQNADRTTKRPPLTELEFDKREFDANILASRLSELITPLGVLVIEGYAGEQDWFSPKQLFQALDKLNSFQVHLFSTTDELRQNIYIQELSNSAKLVLYNESLVTYLLQAEEDGHLRLGQRFEHEEYSRLIEIDNDKILEVPLDIWNRTLRSAQILDEEALSPPPQISLSKRYSEFRIFLSESSKKPVWSGYHTNRKFAFRRNFENILHSEVLKRLKSKILYDKPIILHGQSGIGKSVALAALAYSVRQEHKRHPVLFIDRHLQNPSISDINSFCKWAEDRDCDTTLIIWDGMVEYEQYYEFTNKLTRMGRKIVVLGSCYRIASNNLPQSRKNFIEAPACLSEIEVSEFIKFINEFGFDESLGSRLQKWINEDGERFLVALYRILPETINRIRTALVEEVKFFEEQGINKLSQIENVKSIKSAFQVAFASALLKNKPEWINIQNLSLEQFFTEGDTDENKIRKLIGLVVIPGQFGIAIPLEILMRILAKEESINFVDTLDKINTDVIQWNSDEQGNIFIETRTSLEARLIAESLFKNSAKEEVEIVKEILINIRDRGSLIGKSEINFAVSLVRSIGPNSEESKYFENYFYDISKILTQLREEYNVNHLRLMLQEATLIREAAKRQSKNKNSDGIEEMLDKAANVLKYGLGYLESNKENADNTEFINKQKIQFLVELASVIGRKFEYLLRKECNIQKAFTFFLETKNIVFQALSVDPESYYPIDILSWTTEALFEKDFQEQLNLELRAEISADIIHAFTIAAFEDFSDFNQQQFLRRYHILADLIGEKSLSDEAFQNLIKLNPSAAHSLKAYKMLNYENSTDRQISSLLHIFQLNNSQKDCCRKVFEYLQENIQVIEADGRCIYLLLKVWWLSKTGKQISFGKRQTLPFTKKDWQDCLNIVQKVMSSEEFRYNSSLTYLSAICYFHLDKVQKALDIFNNLQNEWGVGNSRRIKTSHLASTPEGKPVEYSGQVEWRHKNPRYPGKVYVPKLRTTIKFVPQEFERPDIQAGDELSKFHIAFNFIGPIAERIERYSFDSLGDNS